MIVRLWVGANMAGLNNMVLGKFGGDRSWGARGRPWRRGMAGSGTGEVMDFATTDALSQGRNIGWLGRTAQSPGSGGQWTTPCLEQKGKLGW